MKNISRVQWIVILSLIGAGAVGMLQIAYPQANVLGMTVVAVLFGLLILAAIKQEWWILVGVGIVALVVGSFIAAVGFSTLLGSIADVISSWVHSLPTPQQPNAQEMWQYEYVTWPIGLFVLLIAIGNVVTWKSFGGEKIVAVLLTTVATIIGSLLLVRIGIWGIGFGLGIAAWAILFFTGLMPKPAAGATPLVMASAGLGFSLLSVLVVPMQGMLGVAFHGDPTSGIVAVMGFSAAAGIIKLFES